MTIILIAAFIAITMIGKAIYKRYINPIMLFVGVQLIGLILLYGSSFITAELITPSIGYIYIASYLFFILGNLIGVRKKHFFTEKVYKSNVQIKENDETEIKYYETMIITLGIVLLISTLIYWASCISRFGIAAFFNNLLHTKASSTDVSNFVLYLKMISVFLSPYTLYYIIKFNKRKPILFAIIILTILSNIAYTRNVLFYIAILDLLVIAFSRPEGIKKEYD